MIPLSSPSLTDPVAALAENLWAQVEQELSTGQPFSFSGTEGTIEVQKNINNTRICRA